MILFIIALLLESIKIPKWTEIDVYPTETNEQECMSLEIFDPSIICPNSSAIYGGPETCKAVFDSYVKGTCVRDNNTDINDLLTKVDKSIELLRIFINLEKNITIDFNKLPAKMSVILIHQEFSPEFSEPEDPENPEELAKSKTLFAVKSVINRQLHKKQPSKMINARKTIKEEEKIFFYTSIVGNCKDKVSYLYLESENYKIVQGDLNADEVDVYFEYLMLPSEYKIKTKQLDVQVQKIMDDLEFTGQEEPFWVKYLPYFETEKIAFYDSVEFPETSEKYHLDPNNVSLKFTKDTWIWESNIFSEVLLPKKLTNSFEAIVAAYNVTLVANKDSYLPDPFVISFKYYYPISAPIDKIDPFAIPDDDDEGGDEWEDEEEDIQAKLLEKYQAVIYKSGDWTGLPKPNIKINVYSDALDVNFDEIKDIANVEIVRNSQSTGNGDKTSDDEKKGLETKYIIIIVVCCVVVVAVVVIVVVIVVRRRKPVQNKSGSP